MTSALAFTLVKYAGAAYLMYLGIRALLEKSASLALPKSRQLSAAKAFRQAILAEVLNPKTALFFLAFLPQFVHPAQGSVVAQFAQLGLLFVIMSASLHQPACARAQALSAAWLTRHRNIGRWQRGQGRRA